ncbi:hypothetical protein KUCAC02_015471 [Chaenocephalus aceratus]|uniref:Uncharacterized protein n=1 Tax=Chaenocephalus aceratus TaxID=36190 RepID=A0ACB9XZE8_CHAAC|nr:hypothetical protein KUCAC02_015471 [Chaenocephalus aceratus]
MWQLLLRMSSSRNSGGHRLPLLAVPVLTISRRLPAAVPPHAPGTPEGSTFPVSSCREVTDSVRVRVRLCFADVTLFGKRERNRGSAPQLPVIGPQSSGSSALSLKTGSPL